MDQNEIFGPTDKCSGPNRGHIEQSARQRLAQDYPHVVHFERISLDYIDGILTLRGQLPSFYLKQVLQERLRGMEGVVQIANQVSVIGSSRVGANRVI